MKSASEGTFFQTIEEINPMWQKLLQQKGKDKAIKAIIEYLFEVLKKESREEVKKALIPTSNPELGEKIMTIADELRKEGRIEGKSELLIKQLKKRFGTIPQWAQEKLRQATPRKLESWGLKLLDARTLEEALR